MELLMVNYLAQERGVIIHGCGIEKNGKGILFVGESGAGKSTLAKLWDQEDGVDVLSDDRIIVRKKGEQFWMYGTPWHGDAKFASPETVRLERILFSF
jgi:serine kinase of HPr protein (carbohydrate metabolism regulator)